MWLKGIFVRANSQAMLTPIGKLIDTVRVQISKELPREVKRPGRWNASIQWRMPHDRGSTNQSLAVLKLLIRSRITGQIKKKARDNSNRAMRKWPLVNCTAGAFGVIAS